MPTPVAPPPPVAPAPAPATPTASPAELLFAEIGVADPLLRELAAHYGIAREPVIGGTGAHVVGRFSADLTERLQQASRALAAVRADYARGFDAAVGDGGEVIGLVPGMTRPTGPGWDEAFQTVLPSGGGDNGPDVLQLRFNRDAFTAWYLKQDSVAARAFATLYGPSTTTMPGPYAGDGSPAGPITVFSQGGVQMQNAVWGSISDAPAPARFQPTSLQPLNALSVDLRADPELHDRGAVWFDPGLGLLTDPANLVQHESGVDKFIGTVLPIVVSVAVTAGLGSALGIAGGTLAGGAAMGAIGSAVNGLIYNGRISFQDVLRSAFTGLVTAGVGQATNNWGLGSGGLQTTFTQRALAMTGRATLQGALQELVGGRFRDGFTTGLASGLASEISQGLHREIAERLARGEIDATSADQLRYLARAIGSIVRTAADPSNPAAAAAGDFIGGLVGDAIAAEGAPRPPALPPAFDDDGNLMPGIIDEQAPLEERTRQLYERLRAQGLDAATAAQLTGQQLARWQRTELLLAEAGARNGVQRSAAVEQRARELMAADAQLSIEAARSLAGQQLSGAAPGLSDEDRLRLLPSAADEAPARERRLAEAIERLRAGNPGMDEAALRAAAEQTLRVVDTAARLQSEDPSLSGEAATQQAIALEADRSAVMDELRRASALPPEQRPAVLAEIESRLGAQLQALAGITLTRDMQLRALDLMLGLAPITGEAVSVYEFVTGRSPVTGEDASRLLALIGVLSLGVGDDALKVVADALRPAADARALERALLREADYAGGSSGVWQRRPEGLADASAVLRKNLGEPPTGMSDPQAHHLVGFATWDKESQRILNRFGISPNSLDNGMYLTRDVHQLTFSDAYKRWVGDRLSTSASRDDALRILRDIATDLGRLKPGDAKPWTRPT